MLRIVSCLNATAIQFVAQQLSAMVESLENEYQRSLWLPDYIEAHVKRSLERGAYTESSCCHYLFDNDICIYTIKPIVPVPYTGVLKTENLVGEVQIRELEALLLPRLSTHLRTDPIPAKFKTFILVSPIPIVEGDPDIAAFAPDKGN